MDSLQRLDDEEEIEESSGAKNKKTRPIQTKKGKNLLEFFSLKKDMNGNY